ncbi:MAG: histidine kinase N-terminal 7TM domain-containing protein [Thermodesulfobacteriota bacterium]|nr:histidine kinase N-terminal 7TM domain-containing protein [Thermodesulfobacteriota bacterium]
MYWQYTHYIWPFLSSVVITMSMGIYAWRNRTVPGATPFAVLMLVAVVWSLGSLLELSGADLPTKILCANFRYLGVVTAPVVWFALAMQYAGRDQLLTCRNLAFLAIVPFIAILLLWTNEYHGLMRRDIHLVLIGSFSVIGKTYGPWFWVLTMYSYILLITTFIILVEALLRAPPSYRGQPIALLTGLFLSFIGSGLHVLGLSPIPYTDPTAIVFIPAGLIIAWGLFRYNLFNIMPVARDTIFENMYDGVIVLDTKNRIIDFNIAAQNIFGWSPSSVTGRQAEDVLSDQPDFLECFHNTTKQTEVILGAGDARKYYELSGSKLTNKQGRSIGRLIVVHDITERKRAEDALKESEFKFRNLFELSPQAIALIDGDTGRLIDVNDIFCELVQYPKEEVLRRTLKEIVSNTEEGGKRFLKELKTSGEIQGMEVDFRTKEGSILNTLIFARIIKIADQDFIITIFANITDRKQLQDRLQNARKMEAIATLAGGVAHEFNNALAAIMGNLELFQLDLPDDRNIIKYYNAMMDSTRRMSNLTSQLLAYARGGKYQPKRMSLNDLVKDTLPLIRSNIEHSISVKTKFSRDIYPVKTDFTQMQMLLSTVVANAAEAIEEKGNIVIITRNEKVDEDFARQHPDLKPGRYTCLIIKDNGRGMDPETSVRMFEPFFTTKLQGRGLGMAAVYGIVKNHDGWIWIDSKLGKGTTVHIYLPAMGVNMEEKDEEKIKLTEGKGTLLIIEDDKEVMEVSRAMAKKIGYHVLEAETGKEAVDIARNFDGQIDLAMLDIVLPDIRGEKVYELIMEARPDLKVIVYSGYSINGPAQEILDAGAQCFIQKPYTFKALSKTLKEVLEM